MNLLPLHQTKSIVVQKLIIWYTSYCIQIGLSTHYTVTYEVTYSGVVFLERLLITYQEAHVTISCCKISSSRIDAWSTCRNRCRYLSKYIYLYLCIYIILKMIWLSVKIVDNTYLLSLFFGKVFSNEWKRSVLVIKRIDYGHVTHYTISFMNHPFTLESVS